MIEHNKGDIINISSTAGERGFATGSAYNASKFAVMGLTEAVLQEVRKHNIRVTALTPSTVNTDLAVNAGLKIGDEDRMMRPEDVAELVLVALKLPRAFCQNRRDLDNQPAIMARRQTHLLLQPFKGVPWSSAKGAPFCTQPGYKATVTRPATIVLFPYGIKCQQSVVMI